MDTRNLIASITQLSSPVFTCLWVQNRSHEQKLLNFVSSVPLPAHSGIYPSPKGFPTQGPVSHEELVGCRLSVSPAIISWVFPHYALHISVSESGSTVVWRPQGEGQGGNSLCATFGYLGPKAQLTACAPSLLSLSGTQALLLSLTLFSRGLTTRP